VILAFLLVEGFAMLIGAWMGSIIPIQTIRLISGVIFILFGILVLRGDNGAVKPDLSPRNAFASGFSMIFLSEWGDKTQVASTLFAFEYNPLMVLVGVMIALAVLSVMAIY
jgi:putative Ca2+/H+ antiporter (TMEM165/GDT1 family)